MRLSDEPLRVLFAGGGTGGHLMPAVATAEALRALMPSSRLLFLVSGRKAEAQCGASLAGFEVVQVPGAAPAGGLRKVQSVLGAARQAARLLDIVRTVRPQVIVGVGGRRSILPILMGRALGIRTALLESNAVPGATVRLMAPVADCVILQWAQAARRLKARRIVVAGNPVRARLFGVSREAALRRLGLSPHKRTLLVIGGSQGALALNKVLHEALPLAFGRRDDLQVIHLTGLDHLPAALEWQNSRPVTSYRPIGFLNQMEHAYAAADFVLARAGGSTLAELTALGLPAILVPFPYATDDHQRANAAVLAEGGAAVLIEQSELTPERLAQAAVDLTGDGRLRAQMAECARRLGRPRAALTVAAELAAMAGYGKRIGPLLRDLETVSNRLSQAA